MSGTLMQRDLVEVAVGGHRGKGEKRRSPDPRDIKRSHRHHAVRHTAGRRTVRDEPSPTKTAGPPLAKAAARRADGRTPTAPRGRRRVQSAECVQGARELAAGGTADETCGDEPRRGEPGPARASYWWTRLTRTRHQPRMPHLTPALARGVKTCDLGATSDDAASGGMCAAMLAAAWGGHSRRPSPAVPGKLCDPVASADGNPLDGLPGSTPAVEDAPGPEVVRHEMR